MSNMINLPTEIDVSKLSFQPPKLLASGGKTANVMYEGRNIMLETPSLNVPYGVNVFNKPGSPIKFSVDLSLRGADENEQIKALQTFIEAFDERMVDAGVENSVKWFGKVQSREVIKAFYTPLLKISIDPATGAPKPYPPTFKLALRKKMGKKGDAPPDLADPRLSSFEALFYNAAEKDDAGQISQFDREEVIETVLPKRSQVSSIIQCTGVWFAGGKFGTTWKAVQIRVDSQPDQIRGPAFRSDAPDIRAFVAAKKAEASGGAGYGGYGDDEEEESVLAAAVIAPPKAAAPAPAPAPAPVFEDEAVSEPVAAPAAKKIIKKVTKPAPK